MATEPRSSVATVGSVCQAVGWEGPEVKVGQWVWGSKQQPRVSLLSPLIKAALGLLWVALGLKTREIELLVRMYGLEGAAGREGEG